MRWATGSVGTQTWCAARLSVVRGFARYLHTLDPATEVIPALALAYLVLFVPFVVAVSVPMAVVGGRAVRGARLHRDCSRL